MITKGVASVRSPVCNLQQFNQDVTHEAFTDAVVAQFKKDYAIDEEVIRIWDTEELRQHPEIKRGMQELPEWEWAFGQTPEFTYQVQQSFSWGKVVRRPTLPLQRSHELTSAFPSRSALRARYPVFQTLDLRSKHGIVLECSAQLSDSLDDTGDISDYAIELSRTLVGQKYGFLKLDPELERRALASRDSGAELAGVVRDMKGWLAEIV
ncbi:hypothetical protein NMY22_g1026 [Coprinellus aureogranulatus]|nr:hypothetical protein NMY22_g1026 [Coprinellus aureogranulatus]